MELCRFFCAHCAAPITATQAEKIRKTYKFGFSDDPVFCSVECADFWHATHPDICDTTHP